MLVQVLRTWQVSRDIAGFVTSVVLHHARRYLLGSTLDRLWFLSVRALIIQKYIDRTLVVNPQINGYRCPRKDAIEHRTPAQHR